MERNFKVEGYQDALDQIEADGPRFAEWKPNPLRQQVGQIPPTGWAEYCAGWEQAVEVKFRRPPASAHWHSIATTALRALHTARHLASDPALLGLGIMGGPGEAEVEAVVRWAVGAEVVDALDAYAEVRGRLGNAHPDTKAALERAALLVWEARIDWEWVFQQVAERVRAAFDGEDWDGALE